MSAIQPGIYSPDQLSNEEYHADPAIGSSGLKEFMKIPAKYHYRYLDPVGREENKEKQSKALTLGSYAHVSLLEPEKFEAEYKVSPETAVVYRDKKNEKEVPMNKKHGDWIKFEKEVEAKGKTPLLWSEFEKCVRMTAMIKRNELANAAFSNGKAEYSFFAKCPTTGVMLKARPDYLSKLSNYGTVLIDYKTTGISLDSHKQNNNAFELDRDLQGAFHKYVTGLATNGSKIEGVIYVTQEQDPPFLIRNFRMSEEDLKDAHDRMIVKLQEVAECQKSGIWPDYEQIIEDYTKPNWVNYRDN